MLLGFFHDAKTHPQLAHLQLSDETVRGESHGLAQLFDRGLGIDIDAEGHSQKHAQFGYFRILLDAVAQFLTRARGLLFQAGMDRQTSAAAGLEFSQE